MTKEEFKKIRRRLLVDAKRPYKTGEFVAIRKKQVRSLFRFLEQQKKLKFKSGGKNVVQGS